MLALLGQAELIVADEAEAAIAKTAAAGLAGAAQTAQGAQLVLREQSNVAVPPPARAAEITLKVLTAMAERRPFSTIPHAAELTTQQAADFLDISRSFLVELIDRGEIPPPQPRPPPRPTLGLPEHVAALRRAGVPRIAEQMGKPAPILERRSGGGP